MTTTLNVSVVDRLDQSFLEAKRTAGAQLWKAMSEYSRVKVGDTVRTHKELNGLCVLGVPSGNKSFLSGFILDLLLEAAASGKALINSLENNQTILQLF